MPLERDHTTTDPVMTQSTGRCDCGGVAFTIDVPLRDVYNCHCGRCRRFTGHHMAATAAPPEHVAFSANDTLRWYEPSAGVEYGFCGTCGSSMFWRAAAHPEKLSICAGVLEMPTGLRTTQAWWVAEAADYHERHPGLTEFAYE